MALRRRSAESEAFALRCLLCSSTRSSGLRLAASLCILAGNIVSLAEGGSSRGPVMLTLIPLSYVPGFLPALLCGLLTAARRSCRGPLSLPIAVILGGAAGQVGAFLFAFAMRDMIVSALPWMFYAVFVAAGAAASLVCALLTGKMVGPDRGG